MMENKWASCTLGDVITLKRGYDLPTQNRAHGAKPVVSSAGITDYHSKAKVSAPGVVTGRYGTLGSVFYIDQDFWPLNTTLYVKEFKGNDPRFIAYFLKTLNFSTQNVAGAVPGVNRNFLHMIPVDVPPLIEQKAIAAILSAYDDLIENNLRRIKILEEMAQNLYREWFVNFRFPGHEQTRFVDSPLGRIPEGWEVKSLDDLLIFKNDGTTAGEHLRNLAYLPIDCIPRKSLAITEVKAWEEAKSSLHLFDEGDILFGAMRPYFHKVVQAPFKGVTRKTCFVFMSRRAEYRAYSLFTIFQEDTVAYASQHSKGATIPYAVWQNSMAKMKVIIPPLKYAQMFEALVSPAILRIGLFYKHNKNLRVTRDLLLPKLISGEVDVSGIDINFLEEEAV